MHVMLRRNWNGAFRRTMPDGQVVVFKPGEPVEITEAQLPAIARDIGNALQPVSAGDKGPWRVAQLTDEDKAHLASLVPPPPRPMVRGEVMELVVSPLQRDGLEERLAAAEARIADLTIALELHAEALANLGKHVEKGLNHLNEKVPELVAIVGRQFELQDERHAGLTTRLDACEANQAANISRETPSSEGQLDVLVSNPETPPAKPTPPTKKK